MDKDRIRGALAEQLVALYAASGIEKQHDKTFPLGVEIRIVRDVQPPILGGFVWGVADHKIIGHRAVSQGDNLKLLRGQGFGCGLHIY